MLVSYFASAIESASCSSKVVYFVLDGCLFIDVFCFRFQNVLNYTCYILQCELVFHTNIYILFIYLLYIYFSIH